MRGSKHVFPALLLGIFSASSSVGRYQGWETSNMGQNYNPFPAEAEALLKEKTDRLAPISPLVRVITNLPEDDVTNSVWSHLEASAIRNSYQNPIMKLRADFVIQDGLSRDCRAGSPNDSDTSPVESPECAADCIYKGRYCAVNKPKQGGKALMEEILRRLCFDQIIHSTDFKWFGYLKGFAKKNCWNSDNLTACSMEVFRDIDIDYEKILGSCVKDDEVGTDNKNDLLEKQLQISKETPYSIEQLPVVEIGDKKYDKSAGSLSDDHFLNQWCAHFPSDDQPVACDFCSHCDYQRKCLWMLHCDGNEFNPATYQNLQNPKRNGPINSVQESRILPAEVSSNFTSQECSLEKGTDEFNCNCLECIGSETNKAGLITKVWIGFSETCTKSDLSWMCCQIASNGQCEVSGPRLGSREGRVTPPVEMTLKHPGAADVTVVTQDSQILESFGWEGEICGAHNPLGSCGHCQRTLSTASCPKISPQTIQVPTMSPTHAPIDGKAEEHRFVRGTGIFGIFIGFSIGALCTFKNSNHGPKASEIAPKGRIGTQERYSDDTNRLETSLKEHRPSPEEVADLDDVDIEMNNIRNMMIKHGAPPNLPFLPRIT